MAAGSLKTGIETTPETSLMSNIPQTMPNRIWVSIYNRQVSVGDHFLKSLLALCVLLQPLSC
jgi:hypothetical protein